MKKTLPVFLFCFSSLCLPVLCQAQDSVHTNQKMLQLPIQSLTTENGLPQGLVNGIVQDKQGFIWMATKGGLVRYDGYETKVFKNDPADSTSLASNLIHYIYLDRHNRIWIVYATHAVDIFNPVTFSVRHVSPDSDLNWLLKETSSSHFYLFEDSQQRYWVVSSNRKKLRYFSPKHKAPVEIEISEDEKIIALQESNRAEMWICTNKVLYKFQQNKLYKIALLPEQFAFKGERMTCMIQDHKGNWLVGNRGCIEIFNPNSQQWHIVRTPFPDNVTHFLIKAADGKIYFNAGNQVFRLNDNHTLTGLWTNTHKPSDIQALMTDRSNVLWVGTDTFGARLINLSSGGFHSFPYQYGFIFDVLNALHFPIEKIPYRDNIISYFSRSAVDQKDNLWCINISQQNILKTSTSDYLPLFKLKDDRIIAVPVKTRYPGWLQITFDEQDRCWAIVTDRDSLHCHLVKIDPESSSLTTEISLDYRYNQVAWLTPFHKKLCIVYRHAIQIYDPRSKKSVFYNSKDKFGNITLLMATPDIGNDSILWIAGIGNGLMKLNAINGKTTAFTEDKGIPNNTVYAVLTDKHGYLWCSSNKGLFRFNPKDSSVLSFTANDGLQGNEFNRYHFLQTPDGKIFLGGTLGWTTFRPDSIHIDSYQPPTVITGIMVNNKPLSHIAKWKDSVITTMSALVLPYDQNFLTFSFAGLEFNQTEKLSYRYQLEGIDGKWINAGTKNAANYTNLPPGNYTFKVNAGNTAGIWSDSVKTMEIVILPPWWKTWWAYSLYFILVAVAVYAFYRYRINRLRLKHSIILQQKEMEQLKEMDEMKTRFFSNITHEFRTPLSLIIGPLEQVNKDYHTEIIPAVQKKLSLVQRNAKHLLRLINQLLDMAKIEAGNMKITLYRGELGTFIADNISLFNNQAEQKNIQLHLNNTLRGEYLFDADKWQKILVNLLSNAIKFTPEGGQVHISSVCDASGVSLSVKDTGIGIPEEKLPFIFNRFYQADDSATRANSGTGIGLALTRELAGLMGGTIDVESQPGKGTCFTLHVPVKKATGEKKPGQGKPELNAFIPESYRPEEEKAGANADAPIVLIVEDNKELNQFIAETLKSNFQILTAFNGKEGLQIAGEKLPDIIISDIMMPEMDGYTFCEEIKQSETTSHIGVILLSARSSHDSMIMGLKHFADDYITKPFHPEELLLRVNNQADRQQKLRNYYKNQFMQREEKIDTTTLADQFLLKLYNCIEQNIDNTQLSVETLAKEMNMSRRSLNRKLEMVAGLSANKMIRQYRLKKAATLLQSGMKVSETAFHTGFESHSYFSISFKEFYGIAPSEYEKREKL